MTRKTEFFLKTFVHRVLPASPPIGWLATSAAMGSFYVVEI